MHCGDPYCSPIVQIQNQGGYAIGALISKQYFMLFYHFQAPHTVHFLICKKWNGDLLNN